jgi:hypothetical protein
LGTCKSKVTFEITESGFKGQADFEFVGVEHFHSEGTEKTIANLFGILINSLRRDVSGHAHR